MTVYIVLTILALAFAPLCTRNIKFNKNNKQSGKTVYIMIFTTACIILMGLRSQQVGKDTALYVRNFLRIGSYPDLTTALKYESNAIPVYV